jgi:hypothetical protein
MKKFVSLVLSSLLLWVTGCAYKSETEALWSDPVHPSFLYKEVLHGFLVDQNRTSFIVVGERYHYIFQPQKQFFDLLQHKEDKHVVFHPYDGKYIVQEDQVKADISVSIRKPLPDGTLHDLCDAMTKQQLLEEEANEFTMVFHLQGKRYLADPAVNKIVKKFHSSYAILIKEYRDETQSVASRIAWTPLAVAHDGTAIVLIGSAVVSLMVLLLPVAVFAVTTQDDK